MDSQYKIFGTENIAKYLVIIRCFGTENIAKYVDSHNIFFLFTENIAKYVDSHHKVFYLQRILISM